MISCRELVEFLAEYVEGTLPVQQRDAFEEHLRVCPPCVDYMKMYRATIELGKAACSGTAGAPPPMPPELKRAILEARQKGTGDAKCPNDRPAREAK